MHRYCRLPFAWFTGMQHYVPIDFHTLQRSSKHVSYAPVTVHGDHVAFSNSSHSVTYDSLSPSLWSLSLVLCLSTEDKGLIRLCGGIMAGQPSEMSHPGLLSHSHVSTDYSRRFLPFVWTHSCTEHLYGNAECIDVRSECVKFSTTKHGVGKHCRVISQWHLLKPTKDI